MGQNKKTSKPQNPASSPFNSAVPAPPTSTPEVDDLDFAPIVTGGPNGIPTPQADLLNLSTRLPQLESPSRSPLPAEAPAPLPKAPLPKGLGKGDAPVTNPFVRALSSLSELSPIPFLGSDQDNEALKQQVKRSLRPSTMEEAVAGSVDPNARATASPFAAETGHGLGADMAASYIGADPVHIANKFREGDVAGGMASVVGAGLLGRAMLGGNRGGRRGFQPGMEIAPEAALQHGLNLAELVAQNGGATYSLDKGDLSGQRGYAVAILPEHDRVIPPGADVQTEAARYIQDKQALLAHPNANVGVFKRPDGTHQFEISVVTPVKQAAIDAAKKHNQISVWDLQNAQDIPTGGTGGITDAPAGDPFVQSGAKVYAHEMGLPEPSGSYLKVDEQRALKIADAFDQMAHDPSNPEVRSAYNALANDIDKQWDFATERMGIKFEPWTREGQPYTNSAQMKADVANNRHLYFFQGGDIPADHPLAAVDPKTGLSYNDKFRAIHDLFGHSSQGFEFGPRGEENAWWQHMQMFSPEARPAMTSETRGQNSWVNYGKHLRNAEGRIPKKGEPGYVAATERPYAQQKAGLLPPDLFDRGEMGRFGDIDFGPEKTPYAGVHYTNADLGDAGILLGERRGSSPQGNGKNGAFLPTGEEGARIREGRGAPGGIYFYDAGTLGEPQIASRKNAYHVKGDKAIADIGGAQREVWEKALYDSYNKQIEQGVEPAIAGKIAMNDAEHALLDAGWDGYRNSSPESRGPKNAVFLFGDHQAQRAGVLQDAAAGQRGSVRLGEPRKGLGGKKEASATAAEPAGIAESPRRDRESEPFGANGGQESSLSFLANRPAVEQKLRMDNYRARIDEFNRLLRDKEITGPQREEILQARDAEQQLLADAKAADPNYGKTRDQIAQELNSNVVAEPQPQPEMVGSVAAAKADTDFFQQAKRELGEGASISQIALRAQELKVGATNPQLHENVQAAEVAPQRAIKEPTGSTVPLLGKGGKTIGDGGLAEVGAFLNDHTNKRLDPLTMAAPDGTFVRKAEDRAAIGKKQVSRAEKIGQSELRFQLAQENSGRGWYKEGVQEAVDAMSEIHPEIKKPGPDQKMFKAIMAISSLGNDGDTTVRVASDVYDLWKKNGRGAIPVTKPDGSMWESGYPNSVRDVFKTLQRVLDHNGGDWQKAIQWLEDKHPVSELKKVKGGSVPGKAGDLRPGSYAFSEKAGAFYQNLIGNHAELTSDRWFNRTWNRWLGTLVNKDGSLQDSPRSPGERDLQRKAMKKLADKFGVTVSEAQAALWYYEQRLYREHGFNQDSVTYGDSARKYVEQVRSKGAQSQGVEPLQARKDAANVRVPEGDGRNQKRVPAENSEGAGEGGTDFNFGFNEEASSPVPEVIRRASKRPR
jgi:hypothetical protein